MARILVVDDHLENRDLLTYLLGYYGHSVTLASGGAEAISSALADRPDLVLMDIAMPGMDGYTAARLMRSERALAEVPLIAISAGSVKVETALEAGFDDFYQMPIEPKEFIVRLQPYLAGRPAVDAGPADAAPASAAPPRRG
jgi:CheY-like chemotaxis protein